MQTRGHARGRRDLGRDPRQGRAGKDPPRITNGPTLLTGLAVCDNPACGRGLTIRTGKGGQYSYYACSAKINGSASRCSCKAS